MRRPWPLMLAATVLAGTAAVVVIRTAGPRAAPVASAARSPRDSVPRDSISPDSADSAAADDGEEPPCVASRLGLPCR